MTDRRNFRPCGRILHSGMGWIRRSQTLLAGGAVAAALFAAPAQAGTYTVYGCKKPDGTPAPAEGWTASDQASGNVTLTAGGCTGGGPMVAELAPNVAHTKGWYGDLIFTAPSGLPIVGYVFYRAAYTAANGPSGQRYNYDAIEYPADGSAAAFPERCEGGPCSRPATAAPPLSEQSAFVRGNVRLNRLAVRVSCFPDGVPDPPQCHPVAQAPSSARIHRAEVVLEDESDPEFTSPPSGTLFDTSRDLNGTVSASFAAKDSGSGVFQSVIEVDGRPIVTAPIDDNGGKCRKPFVARVPCKAGASTAGTISLDTAILPDGPHNVRLLVQDATGTNEIAYGPISITTRNSVPGRGTPNGTNAADGALLEAAWRGRSSRELRSSFGRTVRITGKLRNPAGQPIVGASLVILKTDLRLGASEEQLALVTTGADGAYGHRFKAGPGMSINVRYKAFAGDPGFSAQQGLTLRVRASASFRAPRKIKRGRRLRFSGRLRGGPIPRTGKLVVLQARVGRRWEDSKTVRTNRAGRFSSSVPTRRGGGRSTVRLRVLVRREASYPYSSGNSAERRVTLVP
jgi:hypothetical protein